MGPGRPSELSVGIGAPPAAEEVGVSGEAVEIHVDELDGSVGVDPVEVALGSAGVAVKVGTGSVAVAAEVDTTSVGVDPDFVAVGAADPVEGEGVSDADSPEAVGVEEGSVVLEGTPPSALETVDSLARGGVIAVGTLAPSSEPPVGPSAGTAAPSTASRAWRALQDVRPGRSESGKQETPGMTHRDARKVNARKAITLERGSILCGFVFDCC